MTEVKKKKSLWGIGIAVLYCSFVLFIVSVVIFSTMQDFSLVEDNYYQKSITHQDKIRSTQNTYDLDEKPTITKDPENLTITITFPDSLVQLGISGSVHFFRPSDKKADQILPIDIKDSDQMIIPTTRLLKGHWIIKLSWESSGKSFYQEENLII